MNTSIHCYKTEWPTCDNVVISLMAGTERIEPIQIGIVEVKIHKTGEHKGEAYIWNLHVEKEYRGRGLGKLLLNAAHNVALNEGCDRASLDWSIEEAPKWVFDWYIRIGFDEQEFGRDCAYMVKPLEKGGGRWRK